MFLSFIVSFVVFAVTILGLAWPLAARLALDPAEKICSAVLLSLLAVYLFAFTAFVIALPAAVAGALPFLALGGLWFRRHAFAAAVRDPDARSLLAGQLLVTAWSVGWLFFITSYSGGSWAGDWFEHWERARFFVERLPHETKFLDLYSLPARPPLANLVTGAFLSTTTVDFPHYQLFTTLLNSLAFLPAALLARRFGRAPAIAVLAALVMLSPAFIQNTTFAWTKLITAAWVLGGLYFFLRARDPDAPRAAAPLCAALLAAGILTHYSAAPYALLLAGAWLIWPPRFSPAVFLISTLLLLTWFGWSLANYGVQSTFLANSTATTMDPAPGRQLLTFALNLRDTFVPHFLHSTDPALLVQRSAWGWWRDWFFQLYQVNLLFIFGSVGWLVLIIELGRRWRDPILSGRAFWLYFVLGAIFLGVAAHSGRDPWGLAHICLQPLVLLGLALLAARWSHLARGWRFIVCGGAGLDLLLGIILHFGAQSYLLDHWLTPGRSPTDIFTSYSATALANLRCKFVSHLTFFADSLPLTPGLALALLAAVLMLALLRAHRLAAAS